MAVRREHHRLGAQSEPSVLDCGRQEKSFITGISALNARDHVTFSAPSRALRV